jgi:hypothetical protein
MGKRKLIGIATAGIISLSAIGSVTNNSQTSITDGAQSSKAVPSVNVQPESAPKAKPICDGTSITTLCTVDGVSYKTYVYHAAVAEKTHTETTTTYQEKVTGYCTLCNDGTYSPSCATGRGACSYHGGVQQWNAPRTTKVPVDTSNTIVDAPAQAAYY